MAVSFPRTNPFTGARNAIGNGVASIRNRVRSSAPVGNGPIATIQRSCKQIGSLGGILLLTQLMILIKDIFAVDALNHFFQLFSHKINKKGSAVVDPNTPKAINTESLANKELVCVVIDSIAVTLQLITALYVRIPLLPSAAQALLMMTAEYLKKLILKEEEQMIISQSDLLESNNSDNNEINPAEQSPKPRDDDNNIDNKKNSQEDNKADKAGEKDSKDKDNANDGKNIQGNGKEQGGGADKTGQGGKAQGSGNGNDGSDDDKTKNSNGQNPNLGAGGLTNPNGGAGGVMTYPGGANNLSPFPGINTNGAPVYIRYDHNGSGSLIPSLGKIN